ncbi:LOW QUALITY PROTEIN: rhamnose oligosaccharide ABC transport system, permease component [Bacillus sp. JCM 19046]|nr:LOW QUALITY PROTEIN: rhamnose oligosaccharide ABC transport system, permease component [Bacillus sp. JCM 19046]
MKKRTIRADIIYYVFVVLFAFVMLYPILWMLASSLKPQTEIFSNAASLWPSEWKWENYLIGWQGFGRTGFDVYFRNSAFVTTIVVIGAILSSSIVAYGFARLKFRFKKLLFACLIATVMLPVQITLIPQYILFHNIGWVNTFYPLIVPAFLGGRRSLFFYSNLYAGYRESWMRRPLLMDAQRLGFFGRIILPLIKPALVTVAIFAFMWSWDDFLAPLIYLNSADIQTISLGLRNFMDAESGTSWGPLLAMSSLSLLPQFIIFLFFQKYLVEGIATTGLK